MSKQTGKTVAYHDFPQAEYEKILASFLPPELAEILADAEAKPLTELSTISRIRLAN